MIHRQNKRQVQKYVQTKFHSIVATSFTTEPPKMENCSTEFCLDGSSNRHFVSY